MNLALLLSAIGVFAPAQEAQPVAKEVAAWKSSDRWISAIRFSPDGKTLACAEHGEERELVLWEAHTGRKRATLGTWFGIPSEITFSADGRLIATDDDFEIQVWEVATGKVRAEWKPKVADGAFDFVPTPCKALGFAGDGRTLLAARERSVAELSLADGSSKSLFLRRVSGSNAAFSADGKTLASPNHQDLDLWDVASGKIRRVLADHRGRVTAPAFSADGKTVVFGVQRNEGREKKHWEIKVYNTETGKELTTISGGAGILRSLALDDKADVILVCHESPSHPWFFSNQSLELRVYDATTGRERWTRTADSFRNTLSPDGKLLATVEGENQVKVWELPQAKTEKDR